MNRTARLHTQEAPVVPRRCSTSILLGRHSRHRLLAWPLIDACTGCVSKEPSSANTTPPPPLDAQGLQWAGVARRPLAHWTGYMRHSAARRAPLSQMIQAASMVARQSATVLAEPAKGNHFCSDVYVCMLLQRNGGRETAADVRSDSQRSYVCSLLDQPGYSCQLLVSR